MSQSSRANILTSANTVPVEEAFRKFLNRAPDTDALMRRFDLAA
jgi:Zn-dependent oligopeptidase